MKTNSVEKQKATELFSNGNAEAKIEFINNLDAGKFDAALIQPIASLIADEDKGVRNSATMFILSSQNPEFPVHVVPFVASEDISIRNLSGEILIKLGSLSVAALIQFNHQNDDDNIKFIVDVLGLIGDQRASLFILGILSSNENDNVILACIEAIGNIKYDGSVDVLMLFYDRNELYKPTVVEALGKIGSKAALNFLMERYPNEDELTQYSILESLGNLGDVDTYFFLLEQLITVSGQLVLPLITSISLLKEKYNLDIPFDNRMKNLLMFTISEGTQHHKKIAFSLIDSFEDKDILCASLKMLGEDYELDEMINSKIFRNCEYIYREISRIIQSKPENMRNVLNLFLQTINYVKEDQIMIDVSMMDIRNIVQSVSGLLTNPDEEVRREAMEILFNLDPDSALLFIDTMVTDENNWNRIRLVELLENFQSEAVDSSLQKLTNDEDEMVRDRAMFVVNSKINQLSTNSN